MCCCAPTITAITPVKTPPLRLKYFPEKKLRKLVIHLTQNPKIFNIFILFVQY